MYFLLSVNVQLYVQQRSLQFFFCKHLVRWLSVGWCFTKHFAEGSRFICCFDLAWSFAKFKLICGDLRWDYFSESLSFCLLQCSILTGTSLYFLDEWNFTFFFFFRKEFLRMNSVPTAVRLHHLPLSTLDSLSAKSKRLISFSSLHSQHMCTKITSETNWEEQPTLDTVTFLQEEGVFTSGVWSLGCLSTETETLSR